MKKKVFLIVFLALVVSTAIIAALIGTTMRSVSLNESKLIGESSDFIFLDTYGNRIDNARRYVKLKDMPDYIPQSFIAIEDKRFYSHNGIDVKALARATAKNIKQGKIVEGGSTISQQLIKNTHLSQEKTLKRKLKESSLAIQLEKKYDKEQIIEMYLNCIYFGNGIYGIGDASEYYFAKEPQELTIRESCSLAAIIKNPSKYCLSLENSNNKTRSDIVLKEMLSQSYISQEQYQLAIDETPTIVMKNGIKGCKKYLNNAVFEASKLLGISINDVKKQGYSVFTYYDEQCQNALIDSLSDTQLVAINADGTSCDYYGILLDNKSCGVKAYYCNYDMSIESVKRQPCSTIKPFLVYAPAIDCSVVYPCTQILDEPITYGEYSPKNYGDSYHGWVSVEDALCHSMNVPAVKTINYLSLERVSQYAKKMGITLSKGELNQALALGAMEYGLTACELASCYALLADGGMYKKASFVKKILDSNGNTVYENTAEKTRVFKQSTAELTMQMLTNTVEKGTARLMKSYDYQLGGKTGTGDFDQKSNSDTYSIGISSSDTFVVWQGNLSMKQGKMLDSKYTGSKLPTLIAKSVFETIYENNPPKNFEYSAIKQVTLDGYGLITDKRIALANALTPFKYRKTAYFPKEYEIELSDNFIKPTVDNAVFQRVSDGYTLTFYAKEIYRYSLVKVQGTEIIEVACFDGNNTQKQVLLQPNGNSVTEYRLIPYYVHGSIIIKGEEVVQRLISYPIF